MVNSVRFIKTFGIVTILSVWIVQGVPAGSGPDPRGSPTRGPLLPGELNRVIKTGVIARRNDEAIFHCLRSFVTIRKVLNMSSALFYTYTIIKELSSRRDAEPQREFTLTWPFSASLRLE